MRYAHEQCNGERIWIYSGGKPTNQILEKSGFKVIRKPTENFPILKLIENYKKILRETQLKGEIYKWELIQKYRGKPNLDNKDIYLELKSINYANLMFHTAKAVSLHLADERPNEYLQQLKNLFDENTSINERIENFIHDTLQIYRELENTYGTHHDERTISAFLTFYNPEKYTFFKDSYYKKYCEFIKVPPQKKGRKYVHYLELVDDLINEYLVEDKELLDLVELILSDNVFDDKNHLILAQDILYQSFDKNNTSGEINEFNDLDNDFEEMSEQILKNPLNQILYGPPGTGKTYNTIEKAVEIIKGKSADSHLENKRIFDELRKNGQIEFVTFHQNYSYEDFVVGLKPDVEFNELRFKSHKGIFYEIARKARENFVASKESKTQERDFESVFNDLISPLEIGDEVEIKMKSGISFWITDVTNSSISFRKSNGATNHTLSIETLRDLVSGVRSVPSGLTSYYLPIAEKIKKRK